MTPGLTEEERATYEWQLWVEGFGEAGQERLKSATALVSRVGGLGGPLAYNLAAAGIGKLILAHSGNVKPSDLNRQILMTHNGLGKPRVASAARRLKELNPRIEIEAVPENIDVDNAQRLVAQCDLVFDCAPRFDERFAMNAACVRERKPLIDVAMFSMEGQITTIFPGKTPCLACIYPEFPSEWKREFPVFAAVSATAAGLAATEGIKWLAGFGSLLYNTLLYFDLRHMQFTRIPVARRENCLVCGHLSGID